MFYELRASSHIQIPCHEFTGGIIKDDKNDKNNKNNKNKKNKNISHGNIIEEVMNYLLSEYCNKIIGPNNGLCITVSGIDNIGDARIFAEDGGTYVNVKFRLIMFKPYNNEIIEGSIATSDESGIRISLGFFEQVFISKDCLPKPSYYDKKNKVWIYQTKNNEKLIMEKDDIVNLKVIKTSFQRKDKPQNLLQKSTILFWIKFNK